MDTPETRPTFIEQPNYDLKLFINGFPKSGLHLLELLVRPLLERVPNPDGGFMAAPHWSGTFHGNSWTNERVPMERVTFKIGRCAPGQYLKGHCGHGKALELFMWLMGIGHIFVYRDPRDVAVSQTYHIGTAGATQELMHPEPELYEALGGFDEQLEAVIVGLGKYPGVMDRWIHYAGWLDVGWTMSVRFEDLRKWPSEMSEIILRYVLERTLAVFGDRLEIENEEWVKNTTTEMVKLSERTELSPSFRKGSVGGWRTHFTERHIQLFKETDTENWLVRLGYEETADW